MFYVKAALPSKFKGTFIGIALCTVFMHIGMGLISPVLALFAKSFDVPYVLVSLTIAAYGLGRMTVDMPVGFLLDRIGRRPIIMLGALIILLSSTLCWTSQSIWELAIYRFMGGVGAAMWFISEPTIVTDIFGSKRLGGMMGLMSTLSGLGSLFGPTLGGLIATIWGLRAPFLFLALMGFIMLIASYLLIRETIPVVRLMFHEKPAKIKKSISFSLVLIIILYAAFCQFFIRAINGTLIPFYGTYTLQLDVTQLGIALSLVSFPRLILAFPSGFISDRIGRTGLLVLSFGLIALSLFIFPMTENLTQFSLIGILDGLGYAIYGGTMLAFVGDSAKEKERGSTMGLYHIATDLGSFTGPIIIGALMDMYGLRTPFYVTALMSASITILIYVFKSKF